MACAHVAGEMRRNLETDISAPSSDFARELFDALHVSDNPKGLGVDESIQKLAALDGAILIQNRHRHVLHIVVEGVTERDHLDERGEEHKKEGDRIAQDGDEFLEEDRAQAAERCALHGVALRAKTTRAEPREAPSSKLQAPEKFQ